jgi:hypothetical protein
MAIDCASRALKEKIRLANGPVRAVYARFWKHPEIAKLFPELQLRTYDLARASIPLMEAASGRCQVLAPNDPVAEGLIGYLHHHIAEEQNHDVWLLDDLEALGYSRDRILARIPSPTAASLVGAQYYWIHHAHPIALVGYMAALEGNVASEDFLEAFVRRTGLPPEGFRTLLLHAREDPHHEVDLDDLIDGLPLTGTQLGLLGISAMQTVGLLARLTEEVVNLDNSSPEASEANSADPSSTRRAEKVVAEASRPRE